MELHIDDANWRCDYSTILDFCRLRLWHWQRYTYWATLYRNSGDTFPNIILDNRGVSLATPLLI